jgi:NhaP-type Na+/H+ or K+/H+ antiporter
MALTILVIGLLVFVGHFLADFFQRTKVPDVLILMFAGILLGPVFHVVEPADFGKVGPVFTTLALIIILFEGGIHLNIKQLAAAAGDTLSLSLATFVATTLIIAHLADLLLPMDFLTSLLVGTILGGTSSAVVVPLIRALAVGSKPSTVLFLESALTDVLVIVLALGLIRALAAAGGGATVVDGFSLLVEILTSFVIAGMIGIAGAFVWSAILDKVRRVPNTIFTTLAYVFILFGLAELSGYSGAIATLAFGVAVANFPNIPERLFGKIFSFRLSAFAEHERAFFGEAVFLVKTFFFVFLGVSMSFGDWRVVTVGLVFALAAYLIRSPMVRLLVRPAVTRRDAALLSALVPKGLASAVLAALPAQAGLPNGDVIQGTVYAAIFFSIVTCAVLVFMIERGLLGPLATTWFGKFAIEPEPTPTPVPEVKPLVEPPLVKPPTEQPEIVPGLQEPNPITNLDEPGEEPTGESRDQEAPGG